MAKPITGQRHHDKRTERWVDKRQGDIASHHGNGVDLAAFHECFNAFTVDNHVDGKVCQHHLNRRGDGGDDKAQNSDHAGKGGG